ncbi:MAG: hypothetical protein ACE5Q6_11980 [Dehalococcoidia bacterium]
MFWSTSDLALPLLHLLSGGDGGVWAAISFMFVSILVIGAGLILFLVRSAQGNDMNRQ